jgi:hypothetical protein
MFEYLENETLRRRLKVDNRTKGVLVCPPDDPPANYAFKDFDVVTKIGDHDIDNEGMVNLDNKQRVAFTYLIPRLARDDAVPVTVLRNGQLIGVSLALTRQDNRLVPGYQGEQPSYFIHGPLVFSPLRADAIQLYARLNPSLAYTNTPLLSRRLDHKRFPDEELVVVTAPMFAHKSSKGYADPVGRIVKDVNGAKIKNLRHLVATFRDCKDDYLTIRFAEDPGPVFVLDRREIEKATEEILEENGIAPSRRGSQDMLKIWKERIPAK